MVVAAVVIVGVVTLVFVLSAKDTPVDTIDSAEVVSVDCTAEVMMCPDGTAVGRTGENCEFAACPAGVTQETVGELGEGVEIVSETDPAYLAALEEPTTSEKAYAEIGQRSTLNGVTIAPLAVTDSRCKEDVQCIWEGAVEVTVALTSENTETEQTILLGDNVAFDGRTVSFVQVQDVAAGPDGAASLVFVFRVQ